MVASRFEVYLVPLDPTVGSEMKKTRPCVIVSPNQINHHLRGVIIAPLTTRGYPYPFRVPCRFQGRPGQIAVDQLRAIDKSRLVKRLGRLGEKTQARLIQVLAEMFAP
jgi:mRNA interferase MazF